MAPNGTTGSRRDPRPPWSPLSVAIITFVLPFGGAVLTVRNLQRLGQLDQRAARELTVAIVAICAVGYAVLISYASTTVNGVPQSDAGAQAVLMFGTAIACFSAQARAFRLWRSAHPTARTSPWLGAIGVALVFMFITALAILPFYTAAQLLGIGHQALA